MEDRLEASVRVQLCEGKAAGFSAVEGFRLAFLLYVQRADTSARSFLSVHTLQQSQRGPATYLKQVSPWEKYRTGQVLTLLLLQTVY